MNPNPLLKTPSNPKSHHPINRLALGFLIVFFLLVKLLLALFLPAQKATLASDLTTDNILKAVNEQRALRNLVLLNTNTKLTSAGQSKADDMIARHYFAHVDPDGHYIWDKIVAAGYSPYTMLGENLAIEFYDTNSLISAWMNSPTHRANILQEGFRDQGMGIGFGDVAQNQYYSAIANTFGTLANQPAAKAPAIAVPATQPETATPKTVTAPQNQKTQATAKPAISPIKIITDNTTPTTTVATASSTIPSQATNTATAIQPRPGQQPNQTTQQNSFALPQKIQTVSSTSPVIIPAGANSASAIIGNQDQITFSDFQTNHYLILIAGVVLLLLMLSDIKIIIEKKLGALDKKMNNIVLLVISLIVVAFIYWM